MLRSPTRRLFAVATMVTAIFAISCGSDITGPSHGGVRFARGISFQPVFPALASQAADAGLVPFTHVHIVLHHADGTIALDTTVDFPPGATELTLSLDVPLSLTAPPTGEALSLNLAYINAEGVTVFEGGPFPVVAIPAVEGAPPPPPVSVPVSYTGPGANATSVVITPHAQSVLPGRPFAFTAQAFDASGNPMPGTPIVFSSSNASLAPLGSPANGSGIAGLGHGTSTITAQLLTGPSDAATLTVQPAPVAIVAVSGSGQAAQVGTALPAPAVAQVNGGDGLGVAGVAVTFTASGGGSASPSSGVTDASGRAQTTWTLGSASGTQTLTAIAAGVTGSASFSAAATPAPASKLVFTTQPSTVPIGATLGNVVVAVQDANNNFVTTFSGPVTIGIGTNPGGASLTGVTTVNAVNGVATFAGLSLNKAGVGYTLVASSGSLTGTSATFNIDAGAANRVEFTTQPAGAVAGTALAAVKVSVKDVTGNVVTTFTGPVQLSIASNPGGATLSGASSVNAVAGVATFPSLSLNKTGTGYTLLAVSGALVSATSTGFSITSGPVATCSIASGGGQIATASSALAPVIITAADAFGNGVPGTTISAVVASGGGSVAPASGVADATGSVSFAWTLGATIGAQSLSTSCAGVTGVTTVGATATTGVAGPASQLAFTTQPVNTTAGALITPAVVVTAKDAVGLTATSFTGNVTIAIGSNPGASALGGTLTIAAVAGVATFNNLNLNRSGTGYSLTAASGVLTGATSTAFNVTAGTAFSIVADSGNLQSGPISALLPIPLVARVLDTLGNPVAGRSITLAVATGGGTIAPTGVLVTDVNGRVRTSWTLGATAGAQTVTATSAGLSGSPVTFTATGTGGPLAIDWTGAIDGTWTTAGNWSPAQVPTSLDSVTIGSVPNMPSITTPVTVHHFVMTGCNTMINTSTLTITGSYIDNSNFCLRAAPANVGLAKPAKAVAGSGTIILSGNGNLAGFANASAIQFTGGTHTVVSATNLSGPVTISGTAILNVGFNVVSMGSDFTTTGSGVLQMQSVNGLVQISGNATFAGGSETGRLTDGALEVFGNFSASGTLYDATGTHQLHINGCNTPQNLNFTAPVAGHGIKNLGFGCSSAKTVTGTVNVLGFLANNGSTPVDGPGATVTINGNLFANGAPWNVQNTIVNAVGATQILGPLFNTNLTIASGTVTLGNATFMALNGNLTVTGATSIFDLVGSTLFMSGNFSTANGGKLQMINPNDFDFMLVAGNATFAGGSTAGLLTNGFIQVEGNFTQGGGAPDAYAASGTHQTEIGTQFLDGPFLRASAKASPATTASVRLPNQVRADAQLRLPKGVNTKTAAMAQRAASHQAQVRQAQVRARSSAARAMKATNPLSAARAAMKARVMAQFNASLAAATVKPSMTRALRARMLIPATVNFANPGFGAGTSHFATGVMSTSEMDMASDVFMDGQLYADDDNTHVIIGSNNVLTSRGAAVFDFQFNNVRWAMLDGANVFELDQVLFTNMDPTVNQFTIQRSGSIPTGDIQPLFGFTFDNVPTTGHYISATDTDGPSPDVLFIDMQSPSPTGSGGFIQLLNGATTNWLTSFDWTGLGTSDSWDDGANWSTGFSPTANDDVVIRAGTPRNPLVDNGTGVFVRNLTVENGAEVDLIGAPVFAFGNVTGPINTEGVACLDGGDLILIGGSRQNTINGMFCSVYVDGNYKVSGPNNRLITNAELVVEGAGNLTVNGGRVDVGGAGGLNPAEFDTWDSGTLTMTNANDQMFVGSIGAYFEGGSTTGRLTQGEFTVVNGCVHTFLGTGAPDAFAPSGTHTVIFSGISNVEFGDPASFLQNARIEAGSEMQLLSDVAVHATLSHGPTAGVVTITSFSDNLLTTAAINQGGNGTMVINGTRIALVTGASVISNFDDVTWQNFAPSYTGNVFDVNRSGATTLTFNNHNFSAVTLGAGGHWLVNRGTRNIHMATPTPGTVTTQVLQLGTGTIIWP